MIFFVSNSVLDGICHPCAEPGVGGSVIGFMCNFSGECMFTIDLWCGWYTPADLFMFSFRVLCAGGHSVHHSTEEYMNKMIQASFSFRVLY